jgi:hypothetical protein
LNNCVVNIRKQRRDRFNFYVFIFVQHIPLYTCFIFNCMLLQKCYHLIGSYQERERETDRQTDRQTEMGVIIYPAPLRIIQHCFLFSKMGLSLNTQYCWVVVETILRQKYSFYRNSIQRAKQLLKFFI